MMAKKAGQLFTISGVRNAHRLDQSSSIHIHKDQRKLKRGFHVAGGGNAAIVPCLKCGGRANRTVKVRRTIIIGAVNAVLSLASIGLKAAPRKRRAGLSVKKKQKRYERWLPYLELEENRHRVE